jgi:hypothetical protein
MFTASSREHATFSDTGILLMGTAAMLGSESEMWNLTKDQECSCYFIKIV